MLLRTSYRYYISSSSEVFVHKTGKPLQQKDLWWGREANQIHTVPLQIRVTLHLLCNRTKRTKRSQGPPYLSTGCHLPPVEGFGVDVSPGRRRTRKPIQVGSPQCWVAEPSKKLTGCYHAAGHDGSESSVFIGFKVNPAGLKTVRNSFK